MEHHCGNRDASSRTLPQSQSHTNRGVPDIRPGCEPNPKSKRYSARAHSLGIRGSKSNLSMNTALPSEVTAGSATSAPIFTDGGRVAKYHHDTNKRNIPRFFHPSTSYYFSFLACHYQKYKSLFPSLLLCSSVVYHNEYSGKTMIARRTKLLQTNKQTYIRVAQQQQ